MPAVVLHCAFQYSLAFLPGTCATLQLEEIAPACQALASLERPLAPPWKKLLKRRDFWGIFLLKAGTFQRRRSLRIGPAVTAGSFGRNWRFPRKDRPDRFSREWLVVEAVVRQLVSADFPRKYREKLEKMRKTRFVGRFRPAI